MVNVERSGRKQYFDPVEVIFGTWILYGLKGKPRIDDTSTCTSLSPFVIAYSPCKAALSSLVFQRSNNIKVKSIKRSDNNYQKGQILFEKVKFQ